MSILSEYLFHSTRDLRIQKRLYFINTTWKILLWKTGEDFSKLLNANTTQHYSVRVPEPKQSISEETCLSLYTDTLHPNWLCHVHFWKSLFLHLPCDSARFISNPCSPLLVCAKAPLSLEQTQHTNTQLCFPQIDLTFCTLFTLLCLAPPYPHPPFPAPSAPDLCPV